LQRDGLSEISKGNKVLLTLVIRKILASSSFAIAGTLEKMIKRLEEKASIELEILDDYETADDTAEDFDEDADGEKNVASSPSALKSAINELKSYQQLAQGIQENAKGKALVDGLQAAFTRTVELGGNRKAVIFTESCRTQAYLADLLTANGYEGQIIQLNGSNSDTESQAVYKAWLAKHNGTTSVSGSKSSDMKAAIVDSFRNEKTILISTESGAEGINLQFCSLLINYDLPWNPQRVEQRIGRCHRYGQKSDVVVLNFVNQGNKADQRVYELLKDKFKLFEGVFGASDEILGAIESGVDIEKRIFDAYQLCTTVEESEAAFCKTTRGLGRKNSREGRYCLSNFD
jgi:SNF2 family DNA or RNA helicase